MITETEDVARAIDAATVIWPELRDDRSALLRRIIQRGAESVTQSGAEFAARRVVAIRTTAGSIAGVYRPDEAERMREEWPA